MAYQAKTPSSAITSARRKRVILLACEDLRPVACSLEHALQSRGWDVSVEFGADARPWVQQTPPGPPSLRVLCIPGSVDRVLAKKLRTAFGPEPDADLHILGVDDSPGLVQEIERLAGVRQPARRSLLARPRLCHPTMVETQVSRERGWLIGATSALTAFALVLGGIAMTQVGLRTPQISLLPAASIVTPVTTPSPDVDEPEPAASHFDQPVLSAVAPPSFEDWEPRTPPEEEDDGDLIIFDDEPAAAPRAVEVVTPPLDEPRTMPVPEEELSLPHVDDAAAIESVPPAGSKIGDLHLPPASGTPAAPAAGELQLPPGFLPVAGMTVAEPATPTLYDPFETTPITATTPAAVTTLDPFASIAEPATP